MASVIKCGGSLFDLADLPDRLETVLGDSPSRSLLICGGGPTANLVRTWDRSFTIGEEPSHWLALRALSFNSHALGEAVDRLEYAGRPDEFEAIWTRGAIPVYDSHRFIAEIDETSRTPLPRRWRVTSDSIAARIAELFSARELILLKSTGIPPGTSSAEAAERGLVDEHFPLAAHSLTRVLWTDLRSDPGTRVELDCGRDTH